MPLIIIIASIKTNTKPAFSCPELVIDTKTMCEICSKLTKNTPERRSGVFIVNF